MDITKEERIVGKNNVIKERGKEMGGIGSGGQKGSELIDLMKQLLPRANDAKIAQVLNCSREYVRQIREQFTMSNDFYNNQYNDNPKLIKIIKGDRCPHCGKLNHDSLKMKKQLKGFIDFTLNNYIEPKRKYVPKGEKIGFSKAKMLCAILLELTNLKNRQISDMTGKSPNVIAQWKGTDDFRNMMQLIRKKYNEYLDSV